MFDNIGEKIKDLAILATIAGFIGSFVVAIIFWIKEMILIGLIVLVGGGLFSWIGSFFLYGFGELISQTTNIAKGSLRMQMLTVSTDAKESLNTKRQTIKGIKAEIVEDYEFEKKGYVDELDKINIPNK
ncbi:MAG: hypothetical protein IKZ38_04295 [Clostridia bacterium]|nr:hypothetical protein [Clostridia bacterium]